MSYQSTQAQQESRDQEISNLIEQGQLKLEKGRVSEAQDSFRQALKISPDNWLAHAYLAETYLSREPSRPELAYPHVVKMQQLDPDSAEGNILAAVYWYKQLNPESARLYAEKAKISRPGDAELRNLLGNIYVALGDTNKALKEYAIAMRMAPERLGLQTKLPKHLQTRQTNIGKIASK